MAQARPRFVLQTLSVPSATLQRAMFLSLLFAAKSGLVFAQSFEGIKHESGIRFGEAIAPTGDSAGSSLAEANLGIKFQSLITGRNRVRRGPIVVKEPSNHRHCVPDGVDQLAGGAAAMVAPTAATILAVAAVAGQVPLSFWVWSSLGLAVLTAIGLLKQGYSVWNSAVLAAFCGLLPLPCAIQVWITILSENLASWVHGLRHR